MPSPLVHLSAGYVIYRLARWRLPVVKDRKIGRMPSLLVITALISLLPDFDAIPGLLAGDFGRFHNTVTHSLILGPGIALIGAGWAFWSWRTSFLPWVLLLFSCFALHIGLDFVTYGERGVMLFWPLTTRRFVSGVSLFYGVRWSEGWLAIDHLITLLTELAFSVPMVVLTTWIEKRLSRSK